MHRKLLLALIAITLALPTFAQEADKKAKTKKKAEAAQKQDGEK